MLTFVEKIFAEKVVLWTLIGTSLIILPNYSLDPVNSPKLFVVGVGGFLALVLVFLSTKRNLQDLRRAHFIAGIFMIFITTYSLFSNGVIQDQFFGVFGRSTGYLALLSLLMLYLISSSISDVIFLDKLARTLIFTGHLALLYGLVQVFELDPVNWSAPSGYTKIFGFLGNPNFQSAFLGIFGSYLSINFFRVDIKKELKIFTSISIASCVFVIYKSESEQGYLVLISGILTNFLIHFFVSGKKNRFVFLFLSSGILVITTIAGMLNKGYLAKYLYKDSIQFRGDYWRAAWKMGVENPLNGVGIDRFGENYRFYRDFAATIRRGPNVTSNSPHNVFLDYLVNAGFLSLLAYLFINLFTVFMIIKYLKSTSINDYRFIGLTAAWIAYVAQSIISVNQLGLAVWGWVLMGALVGSGKSREKKISTNLRDSKPRNLGKENTPKIPAHLLLIFSLVIGFSVPISGSPMFNHISIVSAIKTGDASQIEAKAYSFPKQSQVMFDISKILYSNNLLEQSLKINRDAVKSFPNTFELWQLLSAQEYATESEISKAKTRMRQLDPNNRDL